LEFYEIKFPRATARVRKNESLMKAQTTNSKRSFMDYKYDYFISYARRDNEDGFVDLFVENLEKNLKLRGLFGKKPSVFFDKETICNMDNWERKIREGIQNVAIYGCPSFAEFTSKG
jgi:hypothetical protein